MGLGTDDKEEKMKIYNWIELNEYDFPASSARDALDGCLFYH